MIQELLFNAETYLGAGISVTLTDSRKVSIGPWRYFQYRFITKSELSDRAEKAEGIAIICGAVSGNLEVIDIDLKYDTSKDLWQRLTDAIPESILDKIVISGTKSGGYHLYYRCPSVHPNLKLARRPATADEQKDNPHVKVFVLIETRGEGGYVIAPPTPGYSWKNGHIEDIKTISEEERDTLFEICRSFNLHLDEPIQHTRSESEKSFGLSPIDDYNKRGDVIELLTNHGWTVVYSNNNKTMLRRPGKTEGTSGDFWHEHRWFSVFTTSSEFEPQKAYNPAAVYCLLECNNDWTKCVQSLSSKGYGEDIGTFNRRKNITSFIKKLKEEGNEEDDIESILIRERNFKPKAARKALQEANNPTEEDGYFWSRNDKGKLIINKMKMIDFLNEQGFSLMAYDEHGNDMRLVQIKDFIIEESSIEKAKKTIFEYVRPIDAEVAQWIVNNHYLINNSFMEYIPRVQPDFLLDDEKTAYFPFENGVVKITITSITITPYGDMKKHIWKSAKINFKIDINENYDEAGNISWDSTIDYFPEFLYCICNQDVTRWLSAVTFVGYLLHRYKDPTRPYAIILAEETDNDSKGGGTGKGIFVKAISSMIKTETIDGKNFKLDKSFALQRIGLDTRIAAIQDIRAKMDFESFYSLITEGFTVEKKGQNEFFIPFEKSPKFIFTTNYMIPNEGVHAQRRQRVLPFSDFFGAHLTPLEHFGVQFFSGWDEGSWKVFYNFMFMAVKVYLQRGLIQMPITEGMHLKSLKTQFGEEFKNWFDDYRKSRDDEWVEFKDLYNHFLMSNEYNEHDYTRKRFKKGMAVACEILGLKFSEDRQSPNGNKRVKVSKNRSNETVSESGSYEIV